MYIQRYIEPVIEHTIQTFKVLYVGGARQVGKSTLLNYLAQRHGIQSISLDDITVRELARQDPALFLNQFKTPLFIDEVQYAPELFPYIKLRVDQSDTKGQYWLSGSQHFSLIRGMQESLAGRVGIVSLLGLSLGEINQFPRLDAPFIPGEIHGTWEPLEYYALMTHIFRGSFPALIAESNLSREQFFSSYIQTYLDRDVSGLFGVEKISEFHILLQLLAARTGQVLNISALARDAGISVHAAKAWISILETSNIIMLLHPYFGNISKRLIKAPKLYFTDSGLAAYLTKWHSVETMTHGAMAGALFETYTVMELIKSYTVRGLEPPLFYFRDQQGHEVDILIERDGILYPLEVKRSMHIIEQDLGSLRFFNHAVPYAGHAAVLCVATRAIPYDRTIDIIPVSYIS